MEQLTLATPWVLATVVLIATLCVGGLWLRQSKRPSAVNSDGIDRDSLEARKRSYLRQLEELELEKDRIAEHVYQAERSRLLQEAAQVLKDLDTPEKTVPSVTQTVTEIAPVRQKQSRLGWLVSGILFCVVLLMAARDGARERVGDQPMSGGDSIGMATGPSPHAPTDAELESLGIPELNQITQGALQDRNFDLAMKTVERVRERDPKNAEMLTHLASLQAAVGMTDRALASVETALESRPDYDQALVMKGLLLLSLGKEEQGVAALDRAKEVSESPEDVTMIEQMLAQVKLSTPAGGAANAPAAPANERSSSAGTAMIEGTVRRALGEPFSGGTLFLIVRPSPVAAGPPTASKKLNPQGGVVAFDLGAQDIMLGGPWPDQVWISARLDADGDPLTKTAADWTSPTLGPFEKGTKNVEIVLEPSQQ